jgi:hypothetical protein
MTIASWTAVIGFRRSIHRIKRICSRELGTEKTTSVAVLHRLLNRDAYRRALQQCVGNNVGPGLDLLVGPQDAIRVCVNEDALTIDEGGARSGI